MSDVKRPRILPLPEGEWDPRLDAVLVRLDQVLNIHRVMARNPELLAAWAPLRDHITAGGSLVPRHRELVILRLAHRARSEYEWHHHAIRGQAAGLSETEVAAVRDVSTGEWTAIDAALLAATDELFDTRSISSPTWAVLAAELSQQQLLDVVVTVGVYMTLAMVIAVTGVSIE
ncbi:MAG: carboxymuconolactone decarboxylase family protein [Acidimicrobiia bacterium]|nr:carboxymuconolactone decarboxylase family protein [Acidimicrobiia bacterium]